MTILLFLAGWAAGFVVSAVYCVHHYERLLSLRDRELDALRKRYRWAEAGLEAKRRV